MDKYIGLNEIGKGTSGFAAKAQDKRSGKMVVIKRISLLYLEKVQKEDALVEVSVLRNLNHPSIVKHYDSFMDGDTLCIVMEYAENGDLSAYIKQCKKSCTNIPETQVLRWLTQILAGLAYMHSKNIMHRDLKPQNIFIASGGLRVLIGDFGVCKVLDKKSDLTQTITGTPYYLSPEIFQQKPYSMKSDVWAIGCVLYEMVALRVPFDAVDFHSLGALVMRGSNPPFPSTYSRELRNVFYEIMKRDYRGRPSADELLLNPLIQQTNAYLIAEPPLEQKENIRPNPTKRPPLHTSSPIIPRITSPRCRSVSVEKSPSRVYQTPRSCSPIGRIPHSPLQGILRRKLEPVLSTPRTPNNHRTPPLYPKLVVVPRAVSPYPPLRRQPPTSEYPGPSPRIVRRSVSPLVVRPPRTRIQSVRN